MSLLTLQDLHNDPRRLKVFQVKPDIKGAEISIIAVPIYDTHNLLSLAKYNPALFAFLLLNKR
jgi:hypothetical protein